MKNLFTYRYLQSMRLLKRNSFKYIFRRNCISQFISANIITTTSEKDQEIENLYTYYKSINIPTKESILKDTLGIDDQEVNDLLHQYKDMKMSSAISMQYNINIIKKFLKDDLSLMNTRFWMKVFQLSPVTLTHSLHMLTEIQIPLTCDNIFKYKHITNHTINELLRKNNIVDDDMPTRIFTELEAPQEVMRKLPTRNSYRDVKLNILWLNLMSIFLNWQLDLSKKDFMKLHKSYYFMYRSLKLQKMGIQLIKEHLEFDNKKILSHPYLITGIPQFYEEYLSYKGEINGVNIITLAKSLPSILRRSLDHTKQIEALLDYINVKTNYIFGAPCIYTYSISTLVSRIEYYIRKTSLTDLRLTPNNLILFIYFKRCTKNLSEFEVENGSVVCLPGTTLLNLPSLPFDVMKMKRIFMNQFLYSHLNISEKETNRALTHIGLICYPDFSAMKQNFLFLLNEGFTVDDIRSNFQLLIYPHEVVLNSYHNDLKDTKYAEYYKEINDMDKLLQLLLYKVSKSYINMGGCYV